MLLRETGFTFNGKHSYNDFGLIWSEKNAEHQAIPQPEWNTYEIAGEGRSVIFPGGNSRQLRFSGSLFPHDEPPTQADAQQLLRDVQRWLTAGRQKLIFDYEPDKYYWAQLGSQATWSLKNWFGGELALSFDAEPCAYAVAETVFTATGTSAAPIAIDCSMVTLRPAAARITVANTGGSALTGVSINNGQILFNGLGIAQGGGIVIDCDPPVGAVFSDGSNALPWCGGFRPLQLTHGMNTVTVEVDGASSVTVSIAARGRW